MDIKQFQTARAALTLGKDMTFRDYAQGAYRMRGIGQGQTITLLVIPEVAKLVSDAVSVGSGMPWRGRQSGADAKDLLDVTCWLLINGCRSEEVQASMLLCQNASNVWRKAAYTQLLDLGSQSKVGSVGQSSKGVAMSALLSAWRDAVDLSIPNEIPRPKQLVETLEAKLN
eukprot:735122-Rhodomonas_salina.4